ncbi:Benzoate carboxyl methyltransferase [Vitis vinifera]|uniref:Benzoate carboxyl methyltransferase n=1 Tax=Vitis vinifera TaxID=29760 RepID=A0A438K5Q0_VITVI|nr:Benzoate carboxyl methyltransferase [Vitis vinifera]
MYELSSHLNKCQAPAGLEKNKGHIYIANGSPPTVIEAYTNQFQRDFSLFLGLRSEEIKPGGCMVITIIGRNMEDPSSGDCCDLWELLAKSLLDMLAEQSHVIWLHPQWTSNNTCQQEVYAGNLQDEVNSAPPITFDELDHLDVCAKISLGHLKEK